MKIGIYNPYLDSLGGGEQYVLTLASLVSKEEQVMLFWHDKEIIQKAQDRFHLDLQHITVVPYTKKTRDLDVFICVSDGSIPLSFAKKTILIFQFPVNWVSQYNILNKIKLMRISHVVCYSSFVKQYIDLTFGVQSRIIAPGININLFPPQKKIKKILSVGRFTKGMNTKKQDVLMETFVSNYTKYFSGWSLSLTGGALPKDMDFVSRLKTLAKGHPIEIIPNASFAELQTLYGQASIYWHAAGYNENLISHPEFAEHFGITTVEAMSAGAVPVVYKGGGQTDIVRDGIDGYVWETTQELVDDTKTLVKNSKLLSTISKNAMQRSRAYSQEAFIAKFKELIYE